MPPDAEPVQAAARMRAGRDERDLVAIVGLGCVMPEAPDVPTFWKNVQEGRNSIREVPPGRWDPDLFYSEDRTDPDKTYTKIGAFIEKVEFDSLRFRIPPKVAQSLDDVQKMAILATAQALEDSGYGEKEFDRSRCAVILGQAMGGEVQRATSTRVQVPTFLQALTDSDAFRTLPADQQETIKQQFAAHAREKYPVITEDTMPGELANVVAGRIANVFNLSGANYTTDAACASSLAAIDAAVKSLQEGEYDMVITGGSDRSMDIATYVKFCRIGALSATGSYPFDARADGFVMGEGAGVLVLKRLADAIKDGDKIYGVVRGVGSSSDGKGKGITAPNIDGQIKCVRRAFEHAGIDPATVEFVECHGTSTRVGDVVEVDALSRIWGESTAPGSVAIGSVKSQIGHLKSAAGAAGLIKAVLALKEKKLPPSINFETPNPKINWDKSPFYVNTQTKPWPNPADGEPRRAAVSSFGFGGTNFHVILEEYLPGKTQARVKREAAPAPTSQTNGGKATPVTDVIMKRRATEPTVPAEEPVEAAATDMLVLGAPTHEALLAKIEETKETLASDAVTESNFADFCFQTTNANVEKTVRLAVVATSPEDLVQKLEQAPTAIQEPRKRIAFAARGIYVGEGPRQGKLAMLFPGQGSQYTDMLRDVATRYERIRETYSEADRVMKPFLGDPLTKFVFVDEANGVDRDKAEDALRRTEVCQPAMLAADLALYRLLADHGVKPELVAGHSLGEYGALVAAGVLSLEDAMVAVSARGREMANVHVPDHGKMASVSADAETVAEHLKKVDGYVIAANKNCKVQTVIAGGSDAVDQAVEMFNKQGIQAQHINVSAAFHSEIVAPAREPFANVLKRIDIRKPKVPILTNVSADYYPADGDVKRHVIDILTQQIAAPVEWQKQIRRMFDDGARVFVEVGPKRTLTAFCGNVLEGEEFFAVATNHPKRGGFWHFNDALALLAAWGYPVRLPDPLDASTTTAKFREGKKRFQPARREPARPVAAPGGNGQAGQAEEGVAARVKELGLNLDRLLITGVGVGTPGRDKHLFSEDNIERILDGRNHIDPVDQDQRRSMVDKNIVRLVKSATGDHRFETIQDLNNVVHLMGQRGDFDLVRDYGIDRELVDALDVSSAIAIAAGIEALRDAGIPFVQSMVKTTTGKFLPGAWVLPVPLQEETGVVFASAFPGMPRLVETISDYFASKNAGATFDELTEIYAEAIQTVRDSDVRRRLTDWFTRHVGSLEKDTSKDGVYEFNRRFLFHVLSMGHSQLAQLIKAKGPNTQVNSACSSTTMALAVAEDWIRTGRCKRVLVVGGDDVTAGPSGHWFGAGFLAAGAATTEKRVEDAALPFDRRRHGMIMGMGAVGLVLEAEEEVKNRGQEGIVEVVANVVANSAYHGSRLDTDHVATVMDRLMATVEQRLGVARPEVAKELLFMSHETYTPARGGSAAAEIQALRRAFGDDASRIIVSNTKGFTGHPMGASIEDAIAIKSLQRGRVPPIANLKEPDPELGDLNLSKGGEYDVKYALRLSAGFGSQIGMTFLRLRSRDEKRVVDPAKYQGWLSAMSGQKKPELEVVNRALRVKTTMGGPMKAVASTLPEPAPKEVAPEPATPAPAPEPSAPKPTAPTPTAAGSASKDQIRDRLLDLFAEKTGYPKDMLEPDLDLEADLGIDTVKQAELFGELRDSYQLPQEEGLQLKDYPTINRIVDYIHSRLEGGAPAPRTAAPVAETPAPETASSGPAPSRPAAAADVGKDEIRDRLLDLFAEKTGYPKDMLEPDLDLEADLGIDTVKQAELFGELRDSYGLPQEEGLQLKDYPTINRIVDYIHSRVEAGAAAAPAGAETQEVEPAAQEPVPVTPKPVSPAPAKEAERSEPTGGDVDRGQVLDRLLDLFAEKTGYPKDMLEPDLDLEADLGIDTVKQAEIFGELRESYTLPQEEGLQLKDYPTINRIVDYIVERLGSGDVAPEPAPAASAEPPKKEAAPEPAAAPAPPTMGAATNGKADAKDKEEALEIVTGLVAEKTGYPPELLEPDLDLEADLGIDTVKQAEIFGQVRERFDIPAVEGLQISDYPTLERVAEFVIEHSGGNGATTAAPSPAPVAEAKPKTTTSPTTGRPDPNVTQRYVVRYAKIDDATVGAQDVLRDQRLVVFAPGRAGEVRNALADVGATAIDLDETPDSFDAAKARVAEWTADGDVDGILFILPDPDGDADPLPPEGDALVRGAFFVVKALLDVGQSLRTLGVVTALGGDFGFSRSSPIDPTHGAMAGLAKAVARETPKARVKVVDVPAGASVSTRMGALVRELGQTGGPIEVGTHEGRGTLRLHPEETVEEETGLDLAEEDVLLVPGGAQGITSEIVKELARAYRCKFILLGRTELVDGVDRLAALSDDELAAKKQEIIDAMKARGERPTPVAVEKEFSKITKSIEAHRTVATCQDAGGDALYVPGDVLEEADVANAVELGTKLFGPVTGVLHAAGVEESKLIVDKAPESFARVYDVKVRGARNLLTATTDEPVKFFVTFSSVAGRFGNAGQADYSAANDALAKLSMRLRRDRGDAFAATTIDWSAWADKGMATRGSVMKVLESIGVQAIPLEQGVARFLDEVAHGMRDPEVLVAAELGELASQASIAPPDTRRGTASPATTEVVPAAGGGQAGGQQVLVVEESAEGAQAGLVSDLRLEGDTRVVARLHLDADEDAYLDDHAIDGTPYFPGVFGVEAFAQVAARLAGPDQRFVGVRNMEYRLPLKLLRRRPVDATVICQIADRGEDTVEVGCRLESQFVNAEGQALGAPKLHFTGTLLFARQAPADAKAAGVPESARVVGQPEVYERFFHGPSFQVLAGVELAEDAAVAVGRYSWPEADLFGSPERASSLRTSPLVRELAFQTAGAHGIFQHDRMALPRRIGRSRYYGGPDEGEEVLAVATFKRTGDGVSVYDVVVQTGDGRVLETLTDYEMIHTETTVANAAAVSDMATYRSRWGHDLPVPLDGAKAVLVNDDEVKELDVAPESALTEGERTDQERYRNDKRAREFFLGRLAAKEAVAVLLGRPVKEARGVEIRRLETGRPEVQSAQAKDVLVTISHQGPYAVGLAVRGGGAVKNVGIDFDRIELKPKGFETESFADEEIVLLDSHEESGGDRAEMQLRLWTVKEAVLKALGQGFALSLKSVRITAFDGDDAEVELDESARACLADFDAAEIRAESWTRDNYAYALAWLR